MFTGIIEEIGRIHARRPMSLGAMLELSAPAISRELRAGESVAVNGVCLTVTSSGQDSFACDLSAETLQCTTLGQLREATLVNLERSLLVGARLGGHFVQGHVDGTGRLLSVVPSGECHEMSFEFPRSIERYLVHKGSIAIDGISLTIAELAGNRFTVAVIPHTLRMTNLKTMRPGCPVNLEADILGKYFERYYRLGLSESAETGLTARYLKEQGFRTMPNCRRIAIIICLISCLMPVCGRSFVESNDTLPAFGKDTVLVWKILIQDDLSTFVVRIAQFLPSRFIEWEDSTTQGTILMTGEAITNSRSFVTARLFEAGVDTKGKHDMTLWLSRRIFQELKSAGKAKVSLDSINSWMKLEDTEEMTIEVNRTPMVVPVLKIRDDRGSDRWFLDMEDNPLMVKHSIRAFAQTLTNITTDRHNTLRWIKGKKLLELQGK